MRKFGVVHARYWQWCLENNVSGIPREIGVYLLSCRHGNAIGCFPCPPAYISDDLGYSINTVSKQLPYLIDTGFCIYETVSRLLFLPKYLAWNPFMNQNHAIGAIKAVNEIHQSYKHRNKLLESLDKYGGKHYNKKVRAMVTANRIETVSKPYRNTDTEPDTDTDTEKDTDLSSGDGEKPSDYFQNGKGSKNNYPFAEIVSDLNEKAGRSFRYTSADTQAKIKARLNAGFSLSDFLTVNKFKSEEWKDDSYYYKFLRPETLYGSKFEGYLQAAKTEKPKGGNDGSHKGGNRKAPARHYRNPGDENYDFDACVSHAEGAAGRKAENS